MKKGLLSSIPLLYQHTGEQSLWFGAWGNSNSTSHELLRSSYFYIQQIWGITSWLSIPAVWLISRDSWCWSSWDRICSCQTIYFPCRWESWKQVSMSLLTMPTRTSGAVSVCWICQHQHLLRTILWAAKKTDKYRQQQLSWIYLTEGRLMDIFNHFLSSINYPCYHTQETEEQRNPTLYLWQKKS